MLGDKDGSYIRTKIYHHQNNPYRINLEFLSDWMRGRRNAKPHTWWSLIKTLEEIDLGTTAEKIKTSLENEGMSLQEMKGEY